LDPGCSSLLPDLMFPELVCALRGWFKGFGIIVSKVLLVVFLLITRFADCSPVRAGEARPGTDTEPKDKILGYVLFGSVLVLGSAAAICEVESDREYSRYLETAHPLKMHTYYDRAERYRNLSNAALIGAEVCAVGLVIHLLNGKLRGTPHPDAVRISLQLGPPRAAMSFGW